MRDQGDWCGSGNPRAQSSGMQVAITALDIGAYKEGRIASAR